MKARHKPPTLVSMWMLDVFCCALGCVTLLWLLNTKDAGEQARRAGSALTRLTAAEADRADLRARVAALTAERDDTARALAAAASARDEASAGLAAATAGLAAARDELARTAARALDLTDELDRQAKAAADLERLARRREKERDDAAARLADADARLRAAAAAAKAADDKLAGLKATGDELTATRRKLDDANATIVDLLGQKAKLADKLDRLRAESDTRFAGVALTGTRVAFVVDVSGSMTRVDERTVAPDKWPTVAETVGKVMRSLPGLDKYQVVLFSRSARYLFGDGRWEGYRGEASAARVVAALKAEAPAGDTDLHAGLDLAFRLRADGLDAVYLFSDGLPSRGPGLTAEQERSAPETEKTTARSRHILRALADDWNRPAGGAKVRVNAIGFFFESPEVGAFLWSLARENDGSFVGMSRP